MNPVFPDSVPVSAMLNELYIMTSELIKHELKAT